MEALAPLLTGIIGVFLGSWWTDRLTRRRAADERKMRLESLSTVLWHDVHLMIFRINSANNARDLELNTELWVDIRVSLSEAGASVLDTTNLSFVFALIEMWNAELRRGEYSSPPTKPSFEDLQTSLVTAAEVLERMIPEPTKSSMKRRRTEEAKAS